MTNIIKYACFGDFNQNINSNKKVLGMRVSSFKMCVFFVKKKKLLRNIHAMKARMQDEKNQSFPKMKLTSHETCSMFTKEKKLCKKRDNGTFNCKMKNRSNEEKAFYKEIKPL